MLLFKISDADELSMVIQFVYVLYIGKGAKTRLRALVRISRVAYSVAYRIFARQPYNKYIQYGWLYVEIQ